MSKHRPPHEPIPPPGPSKPPDLIPIEHRRPPLPLILEEEGNLEAAEVLAARVEKIRRSNPYYLHYLAEIANGEERYSDAVILLNRAIRLERSEYRFHQTLAQSQYLIGQTEKAQASLARAKKLAPPELDPNAITLSDESGLPDS